MCFPCDWEEPIWPEAEAECSVSLNFCLRFSVQCLVFVAPFMVYGVGEHLTMQLTWVPWFVAMVIAKGARVL